MKKMVPITSKLQEVYIDLWNPHEPVSIFEKNYMGLLLDKFTQKSWILWLRSKDEFLICLSSGFQEQRHAKAGLTTYNWTVGESLLALHFRVFAKKKESRSDTLHHIYTRKTA